MHTPEYTGNFVNICMVFLMLIHDCDREIQVVLWCARMPPIVHGRFMVLLALVLLDVL